MTKKDCEKIAFTIKCATPVATLPPEWRTGCTVKYQIEYTDTFGGEANYSWVRRAEFDADENATVRTVMVRARKALGLTGLKGTVRPIGDGIVFRPYNMCTIMFISPNYQD